MTDRPIIFSAPMVRALLAGRKTQTRRLATSPLSRCVEGDRLWVREHWRMPVAYDDLSPSDMGGEEAVLYVADGATVRLWAGDRTTIFGRHRQGMHMPRWASRLTLIVETVRVEPLRAIGAIDARAEGAERADGEWRDYSGHFPHTLSAVESFASLWDSLHTTAGERWQDNPQIVALTFRVERANIDQLTNEGN